MSIGMTYEEYWYGDPTKTIDYRRANYYRIETRNQELWLQGLYIYNAFYVVMFNAFAKEGSPKQSYVEKPLEILGKTEEELEAERQKEREKAIKALTAWSESWNARHEMPV